MIVSILGNIASGKSTLIKELRGIFCKDGDTSVHMIEEPVDTWKMFEDFTANMDEYSFAFSMEILKSFAEMPVVQSSSDVYIVERNPLDTVHVFGDVLAKNGHLDTHSIDLLKRYSDSFCWKPDRVVYVDTPAPICFDRIEKRARPGEETLTYEYIRALEFSYETSLKTVYSDMPILRLSHTDSTPVMISKIREFSTECGN